MTRGQILLFALFPLPLATGCLERHDRIAQHAIATPNLTPASTEAAIKVDTIGRKLLAGSPFLFVQAPNFQTVGTDDPELFHTDTHLLYITEGLVRMCQSDDEIAGVLATEIGRMVSEQRRAERMSLPEPIPSAALPRSIDGTTDLDPGRAIELAELELNHRKPAERRLLATTDPKKIAADCLKDAGYDPKVLKTIEPYLRSARKNDRLAGQFSGS